jgi:cell wall-associated NlpC family hydrolase
MRDLADLIGAPFRYGGRGPDAYDCFGLVKECWRRVHGVELPDFQSPTDPGVQCALGATQLQLWQPVPRQAGVMAAIRIGRLVRHCGFLIDEDRMIHAWEHSGGASVVPLNDEWQRRIEGYYRYVG